MALLSRALGVCGLRLNSLRENDEIQMTSHSVNPEGPVLFTLVSQFADVFGGMARELKRGGRSVAMLYTGGLPDSSIYDFAASDFDELINYEQVLKPTPRAELPSLAVLFREAEKLERGYNIRMMEIIRADRHLGQAYVTGADMPVSHFARRFDYTQSVDLCVRLIRYFVQLLDRLRPSVIITAPADAARLILTAIAEVRGIPTRVPGPNYSNTGFQWRVNRFFWPGGLVQAYQNELASLEKQPPIKLTAVGVSDSDRTEYARLAIRDGMSFTAPMGSIYRLLKRKAGDIIKKRQRGYGGYYIGEAVTRILSMWWIRRRLMRMRPLLVELPGDQPYVFFPLVVEPETTLQCEAPMSDNQLCLIDWLAKTVPPGWKVVVKEHPGFTYPRPRFFWEQIERYPNVEIAAIYESGEQLAQRARVVTVINGTLGMQAASAGIPVLAFSPYWWGHFLPHVVYASSYEETANCLRFLAEDANLPAMEDRLRCGEALVKALDANSFDLVDPRILEEKALGEPTPIADIENIVLSLLQSLDGPTGDPSIPFQHTVQHDRDTLYAGAGI